jgi:hypothetical protein
VRVKFNALGTTGLRLAGSCALSYWAGWVAWVTAGALMLLGEFHLRVPDPPGFYYFEAAAGILLPFFALALADHYSVTHYHQVWTDLLRPGRAPLMLDSGAVDRLREELRGNLLLRWFAPPASKHIGGHLLTVSLWYRAVALPQSAGFWQRYGEWLADVVCGYFLMLLAVGGGAVWLFASSEGQDWLLCASMLCAGVGLAVLGYSAVRFAARRQAILDYFRTWLLDKAKTQRESEG